MDRYKEHLVWIDLEMTGLNLEVDTILEVSAIITNNDLDIIAYGPNLVIKHDKEKLDMMDEWNTKHHGQSGLTQAAIDSTVTLSAAQEAILNFLKEYTKLGGSTLCGNSVWQDKLYLQKYMPEVNNFLNYRIIDVSSIKEAINRWYPNHPLKKFVKPQNHRALEDICYSVAELRFYRDNFFIQEKVKPNS